MYKLHFAEEEDVDPMTFGLLKLCCRRIVLNLCNQKDVIFLINNCHFSDNLCKRLQARMGKEWVQVKTKVGELFDLAVQSDYWILFKELMVKYLWHVSYRILRWNLLYGHSTKGESLPHICLTDQGYIDNDKTAKYILRNEMTCIKERFILSCKLCLCNEIHDIWQKMSNEDRMYFRTGCTEKDVEIIPLIRFWALKMQRSNDIPVEYLKDAFESAIQLGSVEAAKYFFQQFPADKVDDAVILCAESMSLKLKTSKFLEEEDIDICCFILSEMSFENRIRLLSCYFPLKLSVLLYSSRQKLFIDALINGLPLTSRNDIYCLLHFIFYKYYLEVFDDFYYGQLFFDVWKRIPCSSRNFIRKKTDLGGRCLILLIKDYFPFLLKKGRCRKKKEFLFKRFQYRKYSRITHDLGKREFFFYLIRERIATSSSLKRYKHALLKISGVRKFKNVAWMRLLRLVHKISVKKTVHTVDRLYYRYI